MAKVYINIHSGPELKNKATLGLESNRNCSMVKGHEVKVFFAADGVHLMNCKEIGKIVGQGKGDVKEHLDHLKETNTKIYVSGMSAKARGYDENILKEYNAEFAMPDILIELSHYSFFIFLGTKIRPRTRKLPINFIIRL